MVHQVAYPFHHYPAIVLGAILRRVGFLLQLLQRGRILLGGARFIELRLQEVDHLVETDIATADGGQQFIELVEVIARQQVLFRILQADAQMLQLVVEDLPTGENVLVAILLTEPSVDLRASAAGGHIAEVRVQPVTARVRLLLGNNFDLIAHLQLVGERHDAAANFAPMQRWPTSL